MADYNESQINSNETERISAEQQDNNKLTAGTYLLKYIGTKWYLFAAK